MQLQSRYHGALIKFVLTKYEFCKIRLHKFRFLVWKIVRGGGDSVAIDLHIGSIWTQKRVDNQEFLLCPPALWKDNRYFRWWWCWQTIMNGQISSVVLMRDALSPSVHLLQNFSNNERESEGDPFEAAALSVYRQKKSTSHILIY